MVWLDPSTQLLLTQDIITYSTIIKGYCLTGDVERAFSVLEDTERGESFPSMAAVGSLDGRILSTPAWP